MWFEVINGVRTHGRLPESEVDELAARYGGVGAGHGHDARLLEEQVVRARLVGAQQLKGPEVAQLLGNQRAQRTATMTSSAHAHGEEGGFCTHQNPRLQLLIGKTQRLTLRCCADTWNKASRWRRQPVAQSSSSAFDSLARGGEGGIEEGRKKRKRKGETM